MFLQRRSTITKTKQNYDPFAKFYDLEYGHKENDIDFYLDMADLYGERVLEIGVGTGRIAIPLAEEGIRVVGIDNSPGMLEEAKNNLNYCPKKIAEKISLQNADMRSFDLGEKFPLCIIPFRAFLHNLTQDDQVKTLQSIYNHLGPNGFLAFDLFVPLYSTIAQSSWKNDLTEEDLAEEDSGISISIDVCHDFQNQLFNIRNEYFQENKNISTASMTYRYIFRYEMEALLKLVGFKVVNVWGGFEKQPYDFNSGIMVFLAQKPGS